jgi:hypothetical protein
MTYVDSKKQPVATECICNQTSLHDLEAWIFIMESESYLYTQLLSQVFGNIRACNP